MSTTIKLTVADTAFTNSPNCSYLISLIAYFRLDLKAIMFIPYFQSDIIDTAQENLISQKQNLL